MQKFTTVSGIAACMMQENIDTDSILPAQWMRSLNEDYGKRLFARLRYDDQDRENPDFLLNKPPFRESRFIVGGANFGCGSSRETAVWALAGFGVRAVIAPSFGDIFYENSFKKGLLPIILPAKDVAGIAAALTAANLPELTVDLERCVVRSPDGREIPFALAATRRKALLEGLDEIGVTLTFDADIKAFQSHNRVEYPWVYERPETLSLRPKA